MSKDISTEFICNALIRCTRSDELAAGVFELVRKDLGLWVMELDAEIYQHHLDISDGVEAIYKQLQSYAELLCCLALGSSDYTLHINFEANEVTRLILPPKLTKLAGDCGFMIEIYRSNPDKG